MLTIIKIGFAVCGIAAFKLCVEMFKDDEPMLAILCFSISVIALAAFVASFM